MKNPKYFISSRSKSADVLAADLILAFSERYPKAEGFGIVGIDTRKTRIHGLAELNDCLKLRLHEISVQQWPAQGQKLFQGIAKQLDQINFQVAILVGYSPLQDELASYFKSREVPVILYGITPPYGWQGIDLKKVRDKVDQYLGFFPKPGPSESQANLPYQFVGSPFRDRTDRVSISPTSLGLPEGKKIIAFLPGSELNIFAKLFPVMFDLAKELMQSRQNLYPILPLSSSISEIVKHQVLDPKLIRTQKTNPSSSTEQISYGPLTIVHSMTLEILSVSHVAVTGIGGASLEACLFKTPFLAIHEFPVDTTGSHCLVNQVWDRPLVEEFSYLENQKVILSKTLSLIDEGPARQTLLQDFEDVRSGLQGSAAKTAADLIGCNFANWASKKISKSDQTA